MLNVVLMAANGNPGMVVFSVEVPIINPFNFVVRPPFNINLAKEGIIFVPKTNKCLRAKLHCLREYQLEWMQEGLESLSLSRLFDIFVRGEVNQEERDQDLEIRSWDLRMFNPKILKQNNLLVSLCKGEMKTRMEQ